jgi:hypothetical protein
MNSVKNAIKTFVISALILDVLAAIYHCACAPVSMSIQIAIGASLLGSLLIAPLASASDITEPVVIA